MTSKEFIEKYLQIKQSDGNYKSIILRDSDIQLLNSLEKASQNGKKVYCIKNKTRN